MDIHFWAIGALRSHCFFTIMNHQRILLSSLARNSQEPDTLTYLNPGFGGPSDMLGILFVNVIITEVFRTKFFLNSMGGFKSAILAIFQSWQNGTFEPVHEIQKLFWPKDFF